MKALSLDEAAQRIRSGELVAYPTETVWGLAADARSAAAVAKLRAWKGRDGAKALPVLVRDYGELAELRAQTSALAERLATKLWPGPLTLIVRCAEAFAPGIASEAGAVGFRCSPHPVARELARAAGAITATSFNRSGEPPCATRAQAERIAGDQIALALGEDAWGTAPSSVVDATGDEPRVLREGAIPKHEIEALAGGPLGSDPKGPPAGRRRAGGRCG